MRLQPPGTAAMCRDKLLGDIVGGSCMGRTRVPLGNNGGTTIRHANDKWRAERGAISHKQ